MGHGSSAPPEIPDIGFSHGTARNSGAPIAHDARAPHGLFVIRATANRRDFRPRAFGGRCLGRSAVPSACAAPAAYGVQIQHLHRLVAHRDRVDAAPRQVLHHVRRYAQR